MLYESIPYQSPHTLLARLPQQNLALLESARHCPQQGRYSYIGVDPHAVFEYDAADPLVFSNLLAYQDRICADNQPHLPPFQGGLIGYLSYDLLSVLEPTVVITHADIHVPLFCFYAYDLVISFDHQLQQAFILSTGASLCSDETGKRAHDRLCQLKKWVSSTFFQQTIGPPQYSPLQCLTPIDQYLGQVETVKSHILAGDIFQANIARCFRTQWTANASPWSLYQALRCSNPAPYAAWLNFNAVQLYSSSPELFLDLQCGGAVTTRPIKGTAARASDPRQDLHLADALRHSLKNRAENTMIVDLLRNDLSRVCYPESIEVAQWCVLESYQSVHHLVSEVKGCLQKRYHFGDLLAASFPGGSITGAPKISAAKIIDALEPINRGPYCGSIGYINKDGAVKFSIAIRTIIAVHQETIYLHAGGAITAASDPDDERAEIDHKLQAIRSIFASDHGYWS